MTVAEETVEDEWDDGDSCRVAIELVVKDLGSVEVALPPIPAPAIEDMENDELKVCEDCLLGLDLLKPASVSASIIEMDLS